MLGVGVSLRHLRGTTAIDAYKVAGFSPQLVLDYENSKFRVSGSTSTAPSVVTATRTGLATQLDASGNLVWNAHNLLTYSEEFDNAAWSKINSTVSANATTAPDGTLTADSLVENAVTGAHNALISFSVISGASYTGAVFIKAGVRTQFTLRLGDIAFGPDDAVFDLSNGSVLSGNGTITSFGNGWYLCTVSATSSATAAVLNILPMASGSISYPGSDGSTSLEVWGAHVYRSDLGGMAPVPLTRRVAGSTTYVPTTSAAVYLPREEAYTYVSGSLVGPYYQKESDARTNLVTYSDQLDNAAWAAPSGNATITANAATSPDGTSNADRFTVGATTGDNRRSQSGLSIPSGYTISVFAKQETANWLYLFVGNTTATAWFDLSTGSLGTVANATATMQNVGDGWYRCSITNASTTGNAVWIEVADGNNSSVGVVGESLLIYGAQLEAGSTPSSHIPTSGSTVTRSADSTTISAANMPAYTDALSFQMDGLVTYADEGAVAQISFLDWSVDINNRIVCQLWTNSTFSGAVYFRQAAAGVTDTLALDALSPGINVPFNIASRHGSTFINGAVDGTALTADTTPTALPDLSATTFDLAPTFNGFIKEFRVWADDIGDTGIAEAST